jgi:hypothetical protein
MDNLVVLHIGHALDLLGVLLGLLRLLELLGNQLLQMLHLVLQVCDLSLTRLDLLVSLMQLSLEVVDVALSDSQLVLSMLQSSAGVIKVISLEVTTMITPHQLIIQFLDARLKVGILLKELSVALLNVLVGVVLCLHLADVVLEVEAQVSARRCDLLKQGAHVLGVACREHPTRVVSRKLGVTNNSHALTPHCVAVILNGEQGDGGVTEDQQVALTELEGLVGSPLQRVVEVITPSRGKPSHHSRVSGLSRNVHMDLIVPKPELTVWTITVRRNPHVAKMVQHIPEQGGKTGEMQPVIMEPPVGSKCDIGVVIHLLKTSEKRINISSIE